MRVLALGSCRIHDPLRTPQLRNTVDLLNRRSRWSRAVYVHDIHEMVQLVRLGSGAIQMPDQILPFAYPSGPPWGGRMPGPLPLHQAEYVVAEVCTDKHYEAAGWTLNVNEINYRIRQDSGAAGKEWWFAIGRGQRPPEALAQDVEQALRLEWKKSWWKRRRIGEGHRLVLRELTFRQLSVSEIAGGLARLQALVARPLLVVPHVVVHRADGGLLAGRMRRVEKAVEAARSLGLPVLDPRTFVDRDGQSRALDNGGADFNHYAADYLPVVGQEIVRALGGLREARSGA